MLTRYWSQLQPHSKSKAWQLITTVKWPIQCILPLRKCNFIPHPSPNHSKSSP